MSRRPGGRGPCGPGIRLGGDRLRGRRLAVPPGARPSEARLREALADAWAGRLRGARVLDLFAGSGAVGLELLSRGAGELVLVEADRRALAVLRRGCARLREETRLTVRVIEARLPDELGAVGRASPGPFDLIFADPPYRFTEWRALLAGCSGLLGAAGELCLQHAARVEPPPSVELDSIERVSDGPKAGLVLQRRRRYGDSGLSFYGHGLAG